MVQAITERGLRAPGVSVVTARKGLAAAIWPLAIVELRHQLFLQARIAAYMGVSRATVSRVLRRAGLSRLGDLQPKEPVQRYERETPGELLHIDIKKLGRFDRTGHRITGEQTQCSRSIGGEFLFVAIDDHSWIAFTQMHPDERKESAVSFVQAATQYFARLGIPIERVITDNGSAFRSHPFRIACGALGIRQKFTRPQTNGKAERFIQSALREWAYGRAYLNSDQRRAALPLRNHFYN
jgi:transposase InsO family protein